jgi:hypothetical protein
MQRPIARDDSKAWRTIRRSVKDHPPMSLTARTHDGQSTS